MAKTESKNLERTYNIPLRKEYLKVPNWKRTKKAVKAVREFLQKHMKSEDVRLGKYLNEELWKHGIKNPPHHVKVIVQKDDQGTVKAELFGRKIEEEKKEEKKKPSKLQEMAKKAGVKMPVKEKKERTKDKEDKKKKTEIKKINEKTETETKEQKEEKKDVKEEKRQ